MITRRQAREAARLARQAHAIYEDRGDALVCLCGVSADSPDAYLNHVFEAVVEDVLTLNADPPREVYALLDDRSDRPAAERLIGVFATLSLAMEAAARASARLGVTEPLAWSHDDPPVHATSVRPRMFGRRWRAQVAVATPRALHWSIRTQPLLGQPATLTASAGTVTGPDRER